MSKKQKEKRGARNNIKKILMLLTASEKKRYRKARQKQRNFKTGLLNPRPGLKEWVTSQPQIEKINEMVKLGLVNKESIKKK